MTKYCERPGCSEPGSIVYGMVPEDLVFWLAPLDPTLTVVTQRLICQRHANSMVVPRGWTLDDRRVEDLHLFNTFRFDSPEASRPPMRARRPSRTDEHPEQLQFDGTGDIERPPIDELISDDVVSAELPTPEIDRGRAAIDPGGDDDDNSARHSDEPWRPAYDQRDDLDGLLEVQSPLLSRAFRGTRRDTDQGAN